MATLERLGPGAQDPAEVAWYAIGAGDGTPIERYLLSTPGTRRICNEPELLGLAYTETLCASMAMALRAAPFRPLLRDGPEERVCVLHLLRGGLNFELRRALGAAFGMRRHASAFMSSQRCVEQGRWGVREDSYRKLDVPDRAVLVVGDVVATGVTLAHNLEQLRRHLEAQGRSLRATLFFTIGGPRAEAVLAEADRALRASFATYERTCVVYIEGRFALAGGDCPLRIFEPGTDLLRRDALLTPDFALSQLESPAYPLERCAIYDAGSRAFSVQAYACDVIAYWRELGALADGGLALDEAMLERFPALDPAAPGPLPPAARAAFWAGLPARGPAALAALCRHRIEALRSAAGLHGDLG